MKKTSKKTTSKANSTLRKITWTDILVCLVTVMVIFEVLVANTQIFITEFKLACYHICISDYNENGYDTVDDEIVAEMIEERQSLYNSENLTVRVAANAPMLIKIVLLISSMAVYLFIGIEIINTVMSLLPKPKKNAKIA